MNTAYYCTALLLVPIFFAACSMERRLIYHPDKIIHQTPAAVGLGFDDRYFTTSDGVRLNGWFIPHPEASRTLLWFHGNAGNVSHRLQNIKQLHDKLKINVFIFDYRGYGRSAGTPTEAGTYLDGAAAMELLRRDYDTLPERLIFFGRSLGAGVAVELATAVRAALVILESPFASVAEMAKTILPLLPLGALLSTRYDSLEKISRIRSPLLVIHGTDDEVVPYAQGRKLFEHANEPKKFMTIPGAGHNDTYLAGGDSYFESMQAVIEWAGAMNDTP